MLEFNYYPRHILSRAPAGAALGAGPTGSRPLEARVKPEWVPCIPGWIRSDGIRWCRRESTKDDMEGLWIQVSERVTYVLAKHFDLQARPEVH